METDFERHLEVGDFAAFDVTAGFGDLESFEVAQGLGCGLDRIVDCRLHGRPRRADDFGYGIDSVGHWLLP